MHFASHHSIILTLTPECNAGEHTPPTCKRKLKATTDVTWHFLNFLFTVSTYCWKLRIHLLPAVQKILLISLLLIRD